MKLTKFISVLATVFIFAFTLCAQTNVVDSGSVDRSLQYTTLNYSGAINTTDSTDLGPFNLQGYSNIINVQYILTGADDDAQIAIKRKESYFPDNWTWQKTIVTSTVSDSQMCFMDTISTYASGVEYTLVGGSSNGDSTAYKVKVVLKKE